MKDEIVMLALGDIILGEDSEFYMSNIGTTLENADVVIAQLEVPYTDRSPATSGMSREPGRLMPLINRIDIVTLAGNHIYDAKEEGISDTIAWLDQQGILHSGAGMDIGSAKSPAIFEKEGCKIGVLSYNCTGPEVTHAKRDKAGCAYVKIITQYSLGDIANPGGPPERIYTFPEWKSLVYMREDIKALRKSCDIVAVYFHKGIVHKPITIADYEFAVAHAAIDSGADVVFSSHSHLLHGIEIYKGKTIYHGLGNGVAWVPSLRPEYFKGKSSRGNNVFNPEKWAQQRVERFGFSPDPEYPTYPFHPEAVNTILAKCIIRDRKIVETRCIPAIVDKDGVTRIVERQKGGEQVMKYMRHITSGAHLNAEFSWDDNEIVIQERK